MEVNNVTVLRQPSAIDWTLSTFYFDGVKKGVGVEDEAREVKVKGETCISPGLYWLDLRYSPKFSHEYFRDDEGNLIRATAEQKLKYHTEHEMIWVRDPKNFEYVLWHWGNDDDDTDACYVVGSYFGDVKGQKGVLESRKKYMEIYPILWRSIKAGQKIGKRVTCLYK